MTRQAQRTGRRAVLLTALALCPLDTLPASTAQAPARLLVTVLDTDGAPVPGLTREDFTLRLDGTERAVLSAEPVAPTAQVVAIFEGLAATQRQTSAALASFIASLDDDTIVDMQSVDGQLDDAIVEAVEDLHSRAATRPVIVMLGQATEIGRSDLPSSQVQGRRQAADLSGDLDQLAGLLAAHGITFYGVSVTEVSLANFRALAAATGGHFDVLPASARLGDALTGIGREMGTQYLVSYAAEATDRTRPQLEVTRPGLTARAAPFRPTH